MPLLIEPASNLYNRRNDFSGNAIGTMENNKPAVNLKMPSKNLSDLNRMEKLRKLCHNLLLRTSTARM